MVSPKIFRSRWAALLWAGGILWTAYDVAENNRGASAETGNNAAVDQDAAGDVVSNADLATIANVIGQ